MYRHTNPEVQFAPPKDGALRHPELLPPADPTSASDPPAQAATGWPCTGAGGGALNPIGPLGVLRSGSLLFLPPSSPNRRAALPHSPLPGSCRGGRRVRLYAGLVVVVLNPI